MKFTFTSNAKAKSSSKKVMLSIWWILKEKFIMTAKNNETINANKYCVNLLIDLKEEIAKSNHCYQTEKGIIFNYENTRLHVAMMTQQKLKRFGWKILIHPLYSSDIALSDYYLFQSLHNSLKGK